jgi:hypothetical protein
VHDLDTELAFDRFERSEAIKRLERLEQTFAGRVSDVPDVTG